MKRMGPIPPAFSAGLDGMLQFGGRSASELAGAGTPVFVYDKAVIQDQIRRFRTAMPSGVLLHYAVKTNPYPQLLSWVANQVDGFDLASSGELDRVASLGRPVSFAGPGKRDPELADAIRNEVTINLESEGEAHRALQIAEQLGRPAKLAVRVNPPFALKGAGMKMGGLASPFGIDHDQVPGLIRTIVDAAADWRGLHVYAGSQSLSADSIIEVQLATIALAAEIATAVGQSPPEVNLGGGFGIPYFDGDKPLDLERVGEALGKSLDKLPAGLAETRFAIELGRWLVGEAGVYLTRVVDRKVSRGRTFLVTDGGLHHMLAASGNFGQLLRRNYPIANASRFGEEPTEEVTVVGCLCTPLDLLGDEVLLPRTEIGDLIALFCAGAYGLSASPQAFLSQPAARDVLI